MPSSLLAADRATGGVAAFDDAPRRIELTPAAERFEYVPSVSWRDAASSLARLHGAGASARAIPYATAWLGRD